MGDADIVVIRAVDGCPRFDRLSAQDDVEAQLRALRAQPDVLAADRRSLTAPLTSTARRGGRRDPRAKDQWHLDMLDADSLPVTRALGDVVVAALDSGMDTRHMDLADTLHSSSGVAFDTTGMHGPRAEQSAAP